MPDDIVKLKLSVRIGRESVERTRTNSENQYLILW